MKNIPRLLRGIFLWIGWVILLFSEKTAILQPMIGKVEKVMIYRVLAIGDVVGEQGVEHLRRHLRSVKKIKDIHFTVVNGENASGIGIMPDQVEALYMAGADVVTLGNHTFGKMQIQNRLDEDAYLLRPANYTSRAPGRGYGIYDCGRIQIGVMNLIPFPASDGGRLMFIAWELVTRRPVDKKVEGIVNMIGMFLLMSFMFMVIFNDIRILF